MRACLGALPCSALANDFAEVGDLKPWERALRVDTGDDDEGDDDDEEDVDDVGEDPEGSPGSTSSDTPH